ncbi:MAG: methyltransferase domain-containing protein [Terriglobales bacterium]
MLQKVRSMFQPAAGARSGPAPAPASAQAALPGILRNSNGLREFLIGWDKAEGRRVLDLGCTSSSNLNFFTAHGHSVYSDDLLLESDLPRYRLASDQGPLFDAAAWMRDNLNFSAEHFDAVLLWDLIDYIPEALIKPLLERLSLLLKPSGTILAYFHTRDAGPDASFFRYHIHDRETLQLRPGHPYPLLRVFNNRHVENLFRGYRSVKFFLARDNLREVLASK